MGTDVLADRRLKFFGLNDQATCWQSDRLVQVLDAYDPARASTLLADAIELHNALQFLENGILPTTLTDAQSAAYSALMPGLRKTIGTFFGAITEDTVASVLAEVDYNYFDDLLELLARNRVFERCTALFVLPILDGLGIGTGWMLACKKLVVAYDEDIRERLLADPRNAEELARKYLDKDQRRPIHLPSSFTRADARALVESYLDSDDPNPNFVSFFWKAKDGQNAMDAGIDNKIRLKAKRRHDKWTEDFFKQNDGVENGAELSISETQTEPVETTLDGLVVKHSYSRRWLEESLDNSTILNNFIYLFEFADLRMMLSLPSFQAHLGVVERFLVTSGKDDYKTGAYFHSMEMGSLAQCVMYERFLERKDTSLEAVIAWFFSEYLKDEFGAEAFKFAPSSRTATYLERCRHLFSEMESIVGQYTLYVEDGAVDHDLLGIAPDQVRYKDIPSVLTGKYVLLGADADARNILGCLFSDQSGLGYIRQGLQANTLARLLLENRVEYGSFAEHQRKSVDFLITHGILVDTGERVRIASTDQFNVLWSIFEKEAASYYHYSAAARALIDEMVAKGWLVREVSLLSKPEASYFNYYLNNMEFGNGPALRNRYTHGRNARGNDEEDARAYFTALKLLVCLVIKMNDDLWLRDIEQPQVSASVS